jgi:alpha-tubulin suppressor-like RCC1 family protein
MMSMFLPADARRVKFLATLAGLCALLAGCVGDEPAIPTEAGPEAAAVRTMDGRTPEAADATVDLDAQGGDAGESSTPDAGPGPAPDGMSGAMCPATDHLCGGACVPDDPRNCGQCGHDCTNLHNVTGNVTCVSGVCTFDNGACKMGFAHCAGSPDLGCETSVSTPSNCGTCAMACPQTDPLCSSSGSSYACVSGCGAQAPTLCASTTCVNTTNDAQNCGGCNAPCTTSVAHASATCAASLCGYVCTASYPNGCNGGCVNFSNDSSNCGVCGHSCPTPANGSAVCSGSSCGISCNPGYSPCGGTTCVDETLNGNCGGCGVTCPVSCASPADAGLSSQCNKVTAIAAGLGHTCALLSDGTVRCWGFNGYGELGFATTQMCNSSPCSMSPQPVPGLAGVTAIAAGDYSTCAIITGGAVKCWGDNQWGQVGVAPSGSCSGTACSPSPVVVSGLSGPAIAIAAGYEDTCVVISGGTVQCWGNNNAGQLGNNSLTASSSPVTVMGLTNAVAIAVGELHACAVRADHTIVCWGDNGDDQLGATTATCSGSESCSTTPVQAGGGALSAVSAIVAADIHTCVLIGINVWCWGGLQFGLGDQANTTLSYTPIKVANVTTAIGVAAGDLVTCALLSGGSAACFGGEPLGDGTNSSSGTIVSVSGLTGATALALGYMHRCALLSTGTVSCWSDNNFGQLGNGTTNPSLTPTPVVW